MTHHTRQTMMKFLFNIASAPLIALLAFAPAQAQPSVYTVAKVAVNTRASDAVTAKERATREGSQRAFRDAAVPACRVQGA